MNNKFVFAILVVVIAAAVTAAVMVEPKRNNDESAASPQPGPTLAVTKDSGPRADITQPTDAPVGLAVGQRAPEWTLNDAHGRTHKLSDYLGQVVVLDFWATWCGPCRAIMPDLQKLHEKYESRGVRVIGINGYERGADPAAFMAKNDYTYGLMVNSDTVMRQYGATSIPRVFVIGVDGTILFTHTGGMANYSEKLAEIIVPHLEEYGM